MQPETVFVTGTFGFACASAVVDDVTRDLRDQAPPARALTGTMRRSEREASATAPSP